MTIYWNPLACSKNLQNLSCALILRQSNDKFIAVQRLKYKFFCRLSLFNKHFTWYSLSFIIDIFHSYNKWEEQLLKCACSFWFFPRELMINYWNLITCSKKNQNLWSATIIPKRKDYSFAIQYFKSQWCNQFF